MEKEVKFFAEQSGKAERVDEFNKNTGQSLTREEYKQQLLKYFPNLKVGNCLQRNCRMPPRL